MKNINEIRNSWGSILEDFKSILSEEDVMDKEIKFKDAEGNDKTATVGGILKKGKDHPAHDQAQKEADKAKGGEEEEKPGSLSGDDFKSAAEKEQDTEKKQDTEKEEKPEAKKPYKMSKDEWNDLQDSDPEKAEDMAHDMAGDIEAATGMEEGSLEFDGFDRKGNPMYIADDGNEISVDAYSGNIKGDYGKTLGNFNESKIPKNSINKQTKLLDNYRNKIDESINTRGLKKFLKSK